MKSDTLSRLLREAVLTLASIAKQSGISYDAVLSWRGERRYPGPESLRAVADVLEAHARKLTTIAAKLRNAADEA